MKKSGSILIVDDEKFIRQILRRTVEREGYTVVEAADGIEAVECLKRQTFDFVISDVRMPRMDGMELLGEIKSHYPEITILLITAFGGEYSSEDVLAAGADSFITKPFKNIEIAQTLTELEHKRRERKLRASR